MSKTTFIDGNQQQGIQGTIVTAQFLNNMNNQRHDGLDEDGHGVLDYAVTGGTGNAYTLTLKQPLPAYITGMPVYFRANRDNTGSATLNINGLGARTIRRVNVNLSAGQIKNGQLYMVMYDGTYFQLVSMPADNITLADAVSVPSANKVAKYNERGILKGAELNMTGKVTATSDTSSTSIYLGDAHTGDEVYVEGYVGITGPTPGAAALLEIVPDVVLGSVGVVFLHSRTALRTEASINASYRASLHLSGVGTVNNNGTLALKTNASGANLTYDSNQIMAFFLKKQ